LHQERVESFLIVPLWDMVVFTTAFALAVYFRKKPEYHKRLVLIATCALTAAAFGRFSAVSSESELFLCRSGFADSVGSGEGLDRLQKNPSGLSVCAADGSHRAIRRHLHLYPRPGVLGENRASTCELSDTSQLAVYQMSFSSL
jgi:hypothetical protein